MKIQLTETVLRDANQSLMATRMPLGQMKEILSTMDQAGYYSVECWGGATFDSCIRYLNENPWERLDFFRKAMPNTKLQMLLRGQNLVGYRHYTEETVRRFVRHAAYRGIDIIRIFDALNDLKNIETALDESRKCGVHASCAIAYTVSPVHHVKEYIRIAKDMVAMGAQSICIKDMAGILSPAACRRLVAGLKESIEVPVILHSHCSTGLAYMTYLVAMEEGIDVLDTAISSFSGGVSQPATETMVSAMEEMGIETGCDMEKLTKINNHFKNVFHLGVEQGQIDTSSLRVAPSTIVSQVPGGMYSNLRAQLKEQNFLDKLDDILQEIPRVRKDLGYPPLVTPMSQMVGAQAVANVLSGKRYAAVLDEIKGYLRGKYGIPCGEINPKLMQLVAGERHAAYEPEPSCTVSADKGRDDMHEEGDALITAMFGELGSSFIAKREQDKKMSFPYSLTENNGRVIPNKPVEDEEILAVIYAIIAKHLNIDINQVNILSVAEGVYVQKE